MDVSEDYDSAAEALAELLGGDPSDYDASEYPLANFEEQTMREPKDADS